MNFDELKKVPLADFILSGGWGYELDRQKSCSHWTVLDGKAENCERLVIKKRPHVNGHWGFKSLTSSVKGTVVDFLMMHGLSFSDIASKYGNVIFDPQPLGLPKEEEKPTDSKELALKVKKYHHYSNNNYLLDRGIPKGVINDFINKEPSDAKANTYGAIFPLLSKVTADLSGEFSGFAKYNSPKNRYSNIPKLCFGVPKGLCITKQAGNFETLFVCESPIESLSLEALHRKHNINGKRAYIATCGSISAEQLKNLLLIFPSLCKKIVLALNNDEGGRFIAGTIEKRSSVPVRLKFPEKSNDWNDVLRQE